MPDDDTIFVIKLVYFVSYRKLTQMWANSTHFKMKFRLALTFCCVITLTNSCTLYRSQEIYEYPSDARVKRDLNTNCGPDDEIPPNRVNTTQNLWDLRNIMEQFDVDAYYVPLDNVGRRAWISGFSGSNGDAIVTKDRVYLSRVGPIIQGYRILLILGIGMDRWTLFFASSKSTRL